MAAGQVRVCQAAAAWADAVPGAEHLAGRFRDRIPRYATLHATLARLVEVEPRPSQLVVNQQSELVMALRTLRAPTGRPTHGDPTRSDPTPRDPTRSDPARGEVTRSGLTGGGLTPAGLADLDRATGQVAAAAGAALRTEGMTRKNLLVWDPEQTRGRPVHPVHPVHSTRDPFHRACTALVDGEHPATTSNRAGGRDGVPVSDPTSNPTSNGTPGGDEVLLEQARRERRALQSTLAALPPGLPTRLPRAPTRTL